jgi:hypothetical protein
MISSFALVLGLGKLSMAIYNAIQGKKAPSSDATNTFEKRNVCRKTAMACSWEAGTYFAIAIIAVVLGM